MPKGPTDCLWESGMITAVQRLLYFHCFTGNIEVNTEFYRAAAFGARPATVSYISVY
jgi:hypothetical protein